MRCERPLVAVPMAVVIALLLMAIGISIAWGFVRTGCGGATVAVNGTVLLSRDACNATLGSAVVAFLLSALVTYVIAQVLACVVTKE